MGGVAALVLVASLVVVVQGRGDVGRRVVEWEADLFAAANGATNGGCASFQILDPPGHYAGYFPIEGTEDGHLFYMYFENRYADPDAPFVFWTNGGPGCSSLFGLFLENGPYDIQEDGTLCWKEHGWDIGHNIVFVEQPINTGFSYSSSRSDIVRDEWKVGDEMVQFFYAFLRQHPELADKDLYLTGESYGGHYIPSIARSIYISNDQKDGPYLNLKGLLIVDPWVKPEAHYYSNPVYAFQENLISKWRMDAMLEDLASCTLQLRMCDWQLPLVGTTVCNNAYTYCQLALFEPILYANPALNYYDIRRHDCYVSGCYDISFVVDFLNDPEIQRILGVEQSIRWRDCSDSVRRQMGWDVATDVTSTYAGLLNRGIAISIVAGDRDLICNYLGNELWIDEMVWDKALEWMAAPSVPLLLNGVGAGYVRELSPLSFVKVENSGHMVPMDQPELALQLLTAFTRGKSYLESVAAVGEAAVPQSSQEEWEVFS